MKRKKNKKQKTTPIDVDGGDLLVVETDVGPPDVIGRHVQHVDAAVLGRLPCQFVIVPVLQKQKSNAVSVVCFLFFQPVSEIGAHLLHPEVGRHDLILEVL